MFSRQIEPPFCSQEEYVKLLEHMIDTCWTGIVVANNKGEYIYSNKKYKEITGFSNQVIRQITAQEMEDQLLKNSLSATKIVLRDKKEFILEQTLRSTNRSVLVVGIPFFDGNNEVQYVISNLLDTNTLNQCKEEVDRAKRDHKVSCQEFGKFSKKMAPMEDEIIYKSKAMSNVVEQISLIAYRDVTVFIRGESGTGKELIAKRLHNESDRKDKPFIKINCSAIPEHLLESELFGYEAGTFTGGSAKGKKGLLEHANYGTMLFDEIGDMPMNLQAKLLRVLQEKEFTKLGGHEATKVDIRFIAATNADVEKLVREKSMREDLYYRLNIIPIKIPSLRERREDIPLLAYHTVEKFNKKYGLHKTISYGTVESMMNKTFSGNVRQLQNIIERLVLLSKGDELNKEDFEMLYDSENSTPVCMSDVEIEDKSLDELMDEYEKNILTKYKREYKNSYKIAEKLQKNQSTIFRKLKKYGLTD